MPKSPLSATTSLGIAIVVATLAVYAPVRSHPFVSLDDEVYVYDNPVVRRGLTAEGIAWAFTTRQTGNWHPLTWISHMADVQAFGLDAGAHHVVNVLLHALNALLLFLVLAAATGARWRSAFVAALFALHPLHVESVAWVAERKDVLSTAFWLLTLGAYVWYAQRPGVARYGAVVLAFGLGLLSKPMLVTLPFVLLLLDGWPLGRVLAAGTAAPRFPPRPLRSILLEKVPLLLLAGASSVVTFLAQSGSYTVASLNVYPLRVRLANAIVSYAQYLAKTVWPSPLCVFYPHPGSVGREIPALHVGVAAALLVALSVACLARARSRPHLAVGWLWYLGTLVPVIGIVQVGGQAMADRYTYVPSIGLFVAATWAAAAALERLRGGRQALAIAGASALAALAAVTVVQLGTWRDERVLYEHAIAVTEKNMVAWNNLGVHHMARGDAPRALECFEEALRSKPDYADAWYNAGVVLVRLGLRSRAMTHYREAVRFNPTHANAWANLATMLFVDGDPAAAVAHARTSLRFKPDHPGALGVLVVAHDALGDRAASTDALRALERVDRAKAGQVAAFLSPQP